MKVWSRRMTAVCVITVAGSAFSAAASGQSGGTVQPGAPGEASRVLAPGEVGKPGRAPYTAADVRFVQGMIPHHAQALDMTSLVPGRTSRRDIRLLAERIEVSQQDEIGWMRGWLKERGEEAADPGAHHHHDAAHGPLMPGMLTEEEMAQLAQATGAAFDSLFLRFMIRHHEGALAMVAELLAAPGAAQEPEIYRFASDVEADQRMEIRRMRTLLGAPPADVPRR